MKSFKKKVTLRFFSLVELLIVVAIIGALVALILPHMESNEQEAKDTACDYNSYGTLRYLTMFRSMNGVYPSGFHTGLATNAAGATTVENMAGFTAANMCGNSTTASALTVQSTDDNEYSATSTSAALASGFATSLQKAGIAKLYYGTGSSTTGVATSTTCNAVQLDDEDSWLEDQTITADSGGATATITTSDAADVTINGEKMSDIAGTSDGVIPLYVTPTIDWDHYYDSTGAEAGDSKVKIALAGQCPNLVKGAFRYYICMFKVYNDGSAAELAGTLCPECGSVNP